jgi:hypothetical protein
MKWSRQVPLQNRVDPFGAIHSVSQRGLLMGNRGGKIHDATTKLLLKRRYASRRWIICECVYKDWHRQVMGPGYTELFFLDEVTALAAGHRPCAFCRRAAFQKYQQCLSQPNLTVDEMDRVLHDQRSREEKHEFVSVIDAPDGIMIAIGQIPYAKHGTQALRWSFDGYSDAGSWADITRKTTQILTPALTIAALQNGFKPLWHPSAAL